MKRSTHQLLAAVLAGFFGLFLTFGSLTSSDFPRGTFGCPYTNVDSHWTDYSALNTNFIHNGRGAWGDYITKEQFFGRLGQNGLKANLAKGHWDPANTLDSDSIPFWVTYYAHGQYNRLEVEWNSVTAAQDLIPSLGESYYYFNPEPGTDTTYIGSNQFLVCKKDSCQNQSGLFVSGCDETETGDPLYEPELDFGKNEDNQGMFGYYEHGRTLVNRFRVAIGNSQNVLSTDTVMIYDMDIRDVNGTWTPHPCYLTKGQFSGDLEPAIFSMELTVSPTYSRTAYKFYTWNQCDVYVDWVEYMDKEQAYPLFWSATTREAAFGSIKAQTDSLLLLAYDSGTEIVGFEAGDAPKNSLVRSIGIINDSLFAMDDSLEGNWPRVRFPASQDQARFLRFFNRGNPRIFDPYYYPFLAVNYTGDQTELDSLAELLEISYDAAQQEGINMVFKLQASYLDTVGTTSRDTPLRNPIRSEIFAETFMALAHGAKGISFYKWQTNDNDTQYKNRGIVKRRVDGYAHPVEDGYHEKWCAVRDVFAQLDAMGDTLLMLERKGAYLAKDSNGNFEPTMSLDSVYFEEESRNSAWIEVGQFQDASNNEYLILVNRRTDYDRHITVETDKSGTWALRDLYTQEQFISSTGDFKVIPFDSGEGRVFALEPEISLDKSAMKP